MKKIKYNISVLHFLHYLQNNVPIDTSHTAIIAGGYVRDKTLDTEFNDVDIFIQAPTNVQETMYKRTEFWNQQFKGLKDTINPLNLIALGTEEYQIKNSSSQKSVKNISLNYVFETMFYNIKIQIMIVNTDPVVFVHENFDIGLCKCYTNGEKTTYTSDFMNDMNSKSLTIVQQNMSYNEFFRSYNKHVRKLQKKYPTYSITVSDHNKKHLKRMNEQTNFSF